MARRILFLTSSGLASAVQLPRSLTGKAQPAAPRFSFGVVWGCAARTPRLADLLLTPSGLTSAQIADVQWADAEDGYNYDRTVARRYRGAFRTLQRAVEWWKSTAAPPLAFVAQLGDLIDGINANLGQSESSLEAALVELRRAPAPAVNIVGNHELYNFDRSQLAQAAWLKHGDREFYSFAPCDGWRVVVLDPYQLALIGHAQDDPRRRASVELVGRKNPGVDPSGVGGDWFGRVTGRDRRFVPSESLHPLSIDARENTL